MPGALSSSGTKLAPRPPQARDFQHGASELNESGGTKAAEGGGAAAPDEMLALVYRELRSLARRYFQRRPGATLQPTELVHEAFLRLSSAESGAFRDRGHFCAVAALAMRQILTDRARRRRAEKRGGGESPVTLTDAVLGGSGSGVEVLDILVLDDVLQRLEALDQRQARVVELRVFGGLTVPEAAEALGISARSVENDWRLARAWLSRELSERSGR